MSFLDSQIIGVLVGAAIGGLGKILYDHRENNVLKKKLENGIKAEIRHLKDISEYSFNDYTSYKELIQTAGKIPYHIEPTETFKLDFLENNIKDIGALDEAFLVPLIEVKSILATMVNCINHLHTSIDNVVKGTMSIKLMYTNFDRTLKTLERIGELCDQLLSHHTSGKAGGL